MIRLVYIRVNLLLYCLMSIIILSGTSNAQIVTNGSFENTPTGPVTGTDVNGWVIEVAGAISPAPELSIVDDTVKHGSHALRVVVNAVGSNPWDIQVVADSLPVQPGETYSYSIWVKSSGSSQVTFTVGNYAFAEYGAIRPSSPNVNTTWREYTMQFTVNDNQTFIRGPVHFSIAANVGDTIYIDNMEIVLPDEVWDGPPLASGQPKFVGSAYSTTQAPNFEAYWNQVTPENAGKWGSVEGTRDVMNWTGLDAAYNFAKTNGFPFHFHVLIWGAQQPAWIDSLSSEEQLEEITEWFEAVAERYPDIDFLEVVNEPLPGHNPPDGTNGRANYKAALGGDGATGWDWVLNAFSLARDIFPDSVKMMLNDFNIINNSSSTSQYLNLIRLLQADTLIDIIAEQGHAFTVSAASALMKMNLDSLASTGLPIQITEFDINYSNDATQLSEYRRVFPLFYSHPGVEGITLWGWRVGLWQANAYLLNSNGTERPALEWLRDYLDTVNVILSVDFADEIPNQFQLFNNYPNPFNSATKIKYSISATSQVRLKVFDVLGRHVQTLVDEMQSPGQYTAIFNAGNLSSGIYFYRIEAGDFVAVKKLILMK